MKALPIRYSAEAEGDMDAIEWWIAEEAADTRPAERYGDRLRRRCERIGRAPYAGVPRGDLQPDMRMAVFEHSATILYRVEPDHVLILRILRRGRDVDGAVRS